MNDFDQMNTLDERLLKTMDVLHTPIWVYDIEHHHIFWANRAALPLWEATSLDGFDPIGPDTFSRLGL
ncbi:hypothetical protein [Aeromonas veronii]|uniref:hypothetical protein n=1 Tax=Aeromonas veronii TaxID=654 RepID=UPI0039F5E0D3